MDRIRSANRVIVNNLFNAERPLSDLEAKQLGLQVNVNWGEGSVLASQARRQFTNAFERPARYFKVSTTSTELAQAATPYRYERQGAFRLFERAEGEIGGNATIVLTYRAFYDATLTYAYKAVVVNQLTALP